MPVRWVKAHARLWLMLTFCSAHDQVPVLLMGPLFVSCSLGLAQLMPCTLAGKECRICIQVGFVPHVASFVSSQAKFLSALHSMDSGTTVSEGDILVSQWASAPHRPAHCIYIDHKRKAIVVAVRGTKVQPLPRALRQLAF